MSVTAILLCAGRGERLDAAVAKALVSLGGRPLFTWSLETLQRAPAIDAIVVVGPRKALREMLSACGMTETKVHAWVEGGQERQHSVGRGLLALPEGCTHVAVHDSARALVSSEVIVRVVGCALEHGAAIAAVPLADSLKRVTLSVVDDTIPRAGLWCAQTPQVFRRDWLERAHAEANGQATDDAALVEAHGHPVHVTLGDPLNLKITTAADLALAEAWLARAVVAPGQEG
ncbi:MAG: 2-C-methyl-D-erythritol 4-phosphate cytidylyltransferase [Candidatus Eisenbacteria bacterium]